MNKETEDNLFIRKDGRYIRELRSSPWCACQCDNEPYMDFPLPNEIKLGDKLWSETTTQWVVV